MNYSHRTSKTSSRHGLPTCFQNCRSDSIVRFGRRPPGEYRYLRQKQPERGAFLGDFRRLAQEAGVREEDPIVDLRDQVRDDLKRVIIL
ncbi:hypothetical protein GJ744_000002 [Endocarpon pusillum]|uniref:Uncharacterized protein n=1 Tax=Endocarpon pusillum TaxID=364733 RepID=A0A8H7ATT2_9EURO|nr:hypothetical protein GJ744_000002 [Endocarpon pusillum]